MSQSNNVPIRPGPEDGDGYAHALVSRAVTAREDLFCTECGAPLTRQESGRCGVCFREDLERSE